MKRYSLDNHPVCRECGEPITAYGKSGLCATHAHLRQWLNRKRAEIPFVPPDEREVAAKQISYEMRQYGVHPQCKGCRGFDCKCYAAPNSVIVYCPRIARAQAEDGFCGASVEWPAVQDVVQNPKGA